MKEKSKLVEEIDHIVKEIYTLKRDILKGLKPAAYDKTKEAFNDLVAVSKESAPLWDKVGAVEEIRKQREK